MKQFVIAVAILVIICALAVPIEATPITISNPSFEIQNSFTNFTLKGEFNFTIVNWTAGGGSQGTFRPSTPSNNFGTLVYNVDVPDGLNVAFSNAGTILQVLSAILQANTTYTLTVDVGDRLDLSLPSHSIQILAGGNLLGSASASPINGNFATATVVHTTSLGDLEIGSALEIRLVNNGGVQINWDNVQLDATLIPEPSTYLLFAVGILGIIGMSYRQRKKAA